MRDRLGQMKLHWLCGGIVALALAAAMGPAAGQDTDGPMLVVRQVRGQNSVFAVRDIGRISFPGETLEVVAVRETGTYPLVDLTKLEFLYEFSGVESPMDPYGPGEVLHLSGAAPNPFSTTTRLSFQIPRGGFVELAVFGVDGRVIRRLVNKECEGGCHVVRWDGCDDGGRPVPGGVYLYKLTAPGIAESRRVVVLR
jgi:hypothetical protein